MKKCECTECGYFNELRDNHCDTYNDLSFTGCTCSSNCEGFMTMEETKLLDRLLFLESRIDRIVAANETKKKFEKLIFDRRRKNEKQNA